VDQRIADGQRIGKGLNGMPACADCGQVHDGVSDPADGEFYCHSCWAQFVIVPEKKGGMMCTICEVHVPAGEGDQLIHIKGKKHLQRLSEQSAPPPPPLTPPLTPTAQACIDDASGPEMTLAQQIAAQEEAEAAVCQSASLAEGLSSDEAAALRRFFVPNAARTAQSPRTTLYARVDSAPPTVELGLLGHGIDAEERSDSTEGELYLNVTDPFCLITVGVQGAGKSHTTNCILEACLLPFAPLCLIRQPMSVMVCHYDQSDANCCEATGLSQPSHQVAAFLETLHSSIPAPCMGRDALLVLCSPSFYHQRKEYYAGVCEVRPLLFKWGRLKAQQLKMLMKLDESSTQLYVSLMLEMLRGYQRRRKVPPYLDFLSELEALCSSQQAGPLRQRIQLLSAFVWEAECNEALRDVGADLAEVMAAGRMIVVDLTDPMMAPADANGVFQVLLETFRFKQVHGAGKLVVFDEAHRYMGLGGEGDALAREITDCARLMRHEGLRLVISTQSPKAMPEELLELVTVLVTHRFQSGDWHAYLSKKVPLPEGSFETIRSLAPGQALVYSPRPCLGQSAAFPYGAEVFAIQVRSRLTADRGASRTNQLRPRMAGAADVTAHGASPSAADERPLLLIKQRVRIGGLTVRTELNGRCGIVVSADAEAGRYGVTLDDRGPVVSVSVRAERLIRIAKGAEQER
jgi:hypothetical protein